MTTQRLIEKHGALYFHYCGPWYHPNSTTARVINHQKPFDVIDDLYAAGEIDSTDRPIVHQGSVYLLDKGC